MTSIHPLSTSQDGFFCQLSGPTLQHCFEVGEAAASSAPLAAPIARLRELHTRMQHLPYVLPSFLSRNAAFSQVPGRPLFPTAAIDQGAQSNRTHDQQPHLHGLPHGSISAPKSLREAVLPRSSVSQDRSTFAVGIGSLLQPQGDTSCDDTFTAKVINVVTSLPFSAVGLHMLRQRETSQGQHHAHTLIAVGAAAALYHASTGSFRRLTRKLDYWTISYSSTQMTKALHPDSAWAQRCATASLLAVPFKPFLVSTAHIIAMEWEFLKQARARKELRKDLAMHGATAAIGTAAFFLEEAVNGLGFEHTHSVWHCLAAAGTATIGGLLAAKEEGSELRVQRLGRRGGRGRRPTLHCSVSSLADLQRSSGSSTASSTQKLRERV